MRTTGLFAAVFVIAKTCYGEPVPAAAAATTSKGVEEPSSTPILGAQIVQGCFSSQGELKFNSTPAFNSKSSCAFEICYASGKKVAGTSGGNECYCGDKYPPESTLVDDKKCNSPCAGYDQQACGGLNYWTIYNTGVMLNVESSDDDVISSASASASATKPAVVTVSGSVVIVTQTSSAQESETSTAKKSSSNTAGIAAGVVVGVVAVAGIVGGIFFFMRRRRNKEIEEEHRRNAAVNAFIHGSKPPSSSGGFSISDSRLDPVMAQRRLSDGSIADNQDYSRKILRVTNA
ncbi:putative wsc domain containing protein [Phaeoacremonium minimum UCRPA7]|uniref:Putative wsc domain containing protein n=1 Tax=Phaeoacremonium minimum (strain UCR-PA7) TaxID=1286976 RepID=R8BQF2_PHAM7|nr:putative wsc domain containing protein [Phaeoacremonium minimum UCRPA7]EOO01554.1 putative wsc domain containing protein [Phaeoacremonium minimum UCRPA7]